MLKNKRNREETYDQTLESKATISRATEASARFVADKLGLFRIFVDRTNQEIAAVHYPIKNANQPDKIVKGKTAESIYLQIAAMNLVSLHDHAAYLGSELAKAEVALKTGREYLQDYPLFEK
jgi:dihydropteroate synthase